VGGWHGFVWTLGRGGAAVWHVGAGARFGGFLEPRQSGENGGGSDRAHGQERCGEEGRGVGERRVGAQGRLQRAVEGAGERRQRRVAKNVSKRTTGETKERLTGGPNVFKF
jgi:hypothetical protein